MERINRRKVISRSTKGITLIALIVTIIVLLILAGITINLTIGQDGILKRAQEAGRNYQQAEQDELAILDKLTEEFDVLADLEGQQEYDNGVNKPKLLEGMTPIKFTEPTDSVEGQAQVTNEQDANWYNYDSKKWANVKLKDGSMFVWIPRYAYKITYYTDSTKTVVSNTKTTYGSVDVKFLIGTTDKYYDENGQIQTAKRQTSVEQTIDTTANYTVHPAFTNESSINYANGGWDKELTGIWVAKFEAGYAGGNNTATKGVSSGINYSQTSALAPAIETGTGELGTLPARNWTDGEYGVKNDDGKTYGWKNGPMTIKYPTFQGVTYAMNYINHNDAYNISRALTKTNNVYGLNASTTDSHMMKNSEWGAVAYLSKSKYGLEGTNIYINNATINNATGSKCVYAVTGCCAKGDNPDAGAVTLTISAINGRTANVYVWTQKEGQKASSTGTIYGIYDLSGGVSERTAGYVANGQGCLKTYGASVAYEENEDGTFTLRTTSTKYTTVYPHDSEKDSTSITTNNADNLKEARKANYVVNTKIYGDAVRETSTAGLDSNSWYQDRSEFWGLFSPFSVRGGDLWTKSCAGVLGCFSDNGRSTYWHGFRAVLVAL